MKSRELDAVARLSRQLLQSWGSESVHAGRVQKAHQELVWLKKKGEPVSERTALRIVKAICESVCEEFLRKPDERK